MAFCGRLENSSSLRRRNEFNRHMKHFSYSILLVQAQPRRLPSQKLSREWARLLSPSKYGRSLQTHIIPSYPPVTPIC